MKIFFFQNSDVSGKARSVFSLSSTTITSLSCLKQNKVACRFC